jgi:hypothetical protein
MFLYLTTRKRYFSQNVGLEKNHDDKCSRSIWTFRHFTLRSLVSGYKLIKLLKSLTNSVTDSVFSLVMRLKWRSILLCLITFEEHKPNVFVCFCWCGVTLRLYNCGLHDLLASSSHLVHQCNIDRCLLPLDSGTCWWLFWRRGSVSGSWHANTDQNE